MTGRAPWFPSPEDLDRAEGLLRRIYYKLPVRNLTDRREIERRLEVRQIVTDALRALGRHSDQKAANSQPEPPR